MNPNTVALIEWLTSPIVYSADPWFRDAFRALARRVANRALVARHYLHLGERQRRTYFADSKQVSLKKIFYALRHGQRRGAGCGAIRMKRWRRCIFRLCPPNATRRTMSGA